MARIISKFNLQMIPEQSIEMSVAATIVGLTIEDNTLKILVDQEQAPMRTRPRTFYISRAEVALPDLALRYVGQFALDNAVAFLFAETDDTPAVFVPEAPLAYWSDVAAIHERLAALETALGVGITAATEDVQAASQA